MSDDIKQRTSFLYDTRGKLNPRIYDYYREQFRFWKDAGKKLTTKKADHVLLIMLKKLYKIARIII